MLSRAKKIDTPTVLHRYRSVDIYQLIATDCGSKSVRSGNHGRPLITLRCLLLMLVSTPLHIVNRCSSAFSEGTFNT